MYHIFFGVYHIFFINSSVDGHLGCVHILTIVNNAVCTFSNYCFLQLYMPKSEIARSCGCSVFSFSRTLHTVFHRDYTNLHPLNSAEGFPFSMPSGIFLFADFFDDEISSLTVPPGSLPGFHYPLIWNILIPELKGGS